MKKENYAFYNCFETTNNKFIYLHVNLDINPIEIFPN